MEENFSDTEHIIQGKRTDRFEQRVRSLRALILVLLGFGVCLTVFASITWNNSSNDILRSLAVTGLITIIASLIGLVGCNKCLRLSMTQLDSVKTNKMKQSPGQEALLIFFYFDFLLLCAFFLYGTWCFFYQDDATAWLEAKYADKESWERDFKGISLATVQNNLKLILTIAGSFSLAAGLVAFACIYYAMKISVFFETIHTVVQVQNLVIILISFLIIYAGAIAKGYYQVPYVEETEPEFLPQVLIFTGVAMIMVAFLGFFASRAESKVGLISYTVFCVLLMINFLIFIVLLNFGSQVLQQQFEDKCNEVMPYFHKNFYEVFGCMNKYTQNTTDASYLTCHKDQIATVWEPNVGIPVDDQGEMFGCLNEKCCIAMISFVKGKFNFLAAFCIVAFFFILVAIMTSQYMYRKIKKYQTQILSHRNDKYIFMFMILFTIGLGVYLKLTMPEGPKGMPQPKREDSQISKEDQWNFYELHVDRTIGLGELNEEGWWNFNRIQLINSDFNPHPKGSQAAQAYESDVRVEISLQSNPPNGEFIIDGNYSTQSAVIDPKNGNITLKGKIPEVNQTLSLLLFRPGCLLNPNNSLELNITYFNQPKRQLQYDDEDAVAFGVPRKYHLNLNINSGYNRTYRGKLVEENLQASGPTNYFRELSNSSDVKITVTIPTSKNCIPMNVPVDGKGIFEFNMTTLNRTIPYIMKIQADKPGHPSIIFDYFVGGYPITDTVELGTYAFYTEDNKTHNVTGRVFEAFNNKTFQEDYQINVYQGYGEMNRTKGAPYEVLTINGNGVYYSGMYELYDLKSGSYVAVVDPPVGFIKNFQRFYALPSPPFSKQMRSIPLVPELGESELALVLTWGYSPRDLDIHVEFVASPTILCKCDYSMHQCGGVKYQTDTIYGGDRGADVIKFDYIGDFQYIVYISLFKHKSSSPKATANSTSNTTNTTQSSNQDVTLAESQAQLKIFAPYYTWPVYIFDVPAAAANPTYNYWTVFCFNGKDGLKNLTPINALTQGSPDVSTCHEIYGTPNALKKDVDVSADGGQQ